LKKRKLELFDIINNTVMLFVLLVIVYPFLHIIAVSFSNPVEVVQNNVSFYPKGVSLESYQIIFTNSRLFLSYINTIKYVTAGTVINFIMTVIFAYPLSKKEIWLSKPVTLMVVFTMLFSAGLIPTYLVVSGLDMINTIWAVVIPPAINAFNLLIVRTAYAQIPKEMEESVEIDGGSVYTKLFNIAIPLSKSTLAAITLFYLVQHWNSFFAAMIYITDTEKWPLSLLLREMIIRAQFTDENTNMEMMSRVTPQGVKYATIMVSVVPMLIIYPFVQKYFVKGIMIGGIKG